MEAVVKRNHRGDYHIEIAGRFRLFVGRAGRLNGFFDIDKTKSRKTYARAQATASHTLLYFAAAYHFPAAGLRSLSVEKRTYLERFEELLRYGHEGPFTKLRGAINELL